MPQEMSAFAIAVAGQLSRRRRCANARHLRKRGPNRKEMSSLRSRPCTNLRARDPLHALRTASSTVRPTQGAESETSCYPRSRKEGDMKYKIEPILSGADIGRTKRCQHGAKPCEHCSTCDVGKRHVISLNDEELDVMLRA